MSCQFDRFSEYSNGQSLAVFVSRVPEKAPQRDFSTGTVRLHSCSKVRGRRAVRRTCGLHLQAQPALLSVPSTISLPW